MAEELVEVISTLTPNGHPQYGSCTFRAHEAEVVFKDGRARVPPELAVLLVGRADMSVLDARTTWEPPPPNPGVSEPDLEYVNPGSTDMPLPPPEPTAEDRARDEARIEALSEGMDVPNFPIPQGFVTHMEDDSRRCLAGKTDGSQCSNPAKLGTWACGLGAHVTAVAALPQQLP
jgi:hypothetical protein